MSQTSGDTRFTGRFAEIPKNRCEELLTMTRRTPVAFEIDDLDAETGWSVVVRGFSERVTSSYNLSTPWRTGPVPWAGGVRNVFVTINPESITGRAVKSAD